MWLKHYGPLALARCLIRCSVTNSERKEKGKRWDLVSCKSQDCCSNYVFLHPGREGYNCFSHCLPKTQAHDKVSTNFSLRTIKSIIYIEKTSFLSTWLGMLPFVKQESCYFRDSHFWLFPEPSFPYRSHHSNLDKLFLCSLGEVVSILVRSLLFQILLSSTIDLREGISSCHWRKTSYLVIQVKDKEERDLVSKKFTD